MGILGQSSSLGTGLCLLVSIIWLGVATGLPVKHSLQSEELLATLKTSPLSSPPSLMELASELVVDPGCYIARGKWNQPRESIAMCKQGYTMTGGGCYQARRYRSYNAMATKCAPDGNGWSAKMGGYWGQSYAVAVCCKIPMKLCKTVDATSTKGKGKEVTCPGGYVATGGGVEMLDKGGNRLALLYDSYPSGENAWYGRTDGTFSVYARCCKKELLNCETRKSSTGNYKWAVCTGKKKLVGGGFSNKRTSRDWLAVFEEAWPRSSTAWNTDFGYGSGSGVAYARCCSFNQDSTTPCEAGNGGCDKLSRCTKKMGTWGDTTCGPCPQGYKGTGREGCEDIDECRHKLHRCHSLTYCINTEGGYECSPCPPGYRGDGKRGCHDINECEYDNGGCDPKTKCSNTPGGFTCGMCPNGYQKADGSRPCRDIDECSRNYGGCDIKTLCINTIGSSKCSECPSGWLGNGAQKGGCVDVNECKKNNGNCDFKVKCKNLPGTRECGLCPEGYRKIPGDKPCVDIDECKKNNGGCHHKSNCMNTRGSFRCGACPVGYHGDGEHGCFDDDECEKNNGGCDALTRCVNTPGHRTCTSCPRGYEGSGASGCVDINECTNSELKNGGCDENTKCFNTPGSRECSACPPGFRGTGYSGCISPAIAAQLPEAFSRTEVASAAATKAARKVSFTLGQISLKAAADHAAQLGLYRQEQNARTLATRLEHEKNALEERTRNRIAKELRLKKELAKGIKQEGAQQTRLLLDGAFAGTPYTITSKLENLDTVSDDSESDSDGDQSKSSEATAEDEKKSFKVENGAQAESNPDA